MAVSYKILKYSAVCQTSLGIFLMVLGCFDRSHMYRRYPTVAVLPLWIGFWVVVTGFFGMGVGYGRPDGPKIPVLSRALGKTKTSNYLGLSLVSCIFVGIMTMSYIYGIASRSTCPDDKRQNEYCHMSNGVGGVIIVIATIEVGVSIWACACCCYRSHRTLRQGQTVFVQNYYGQAAAYVIDVIDATGRTVVLRNPLDVLDSNPARQQGLWNDGVDLGPPPPYTAPDDVNEQEGRVDPMPDTPGLHGVVD